MEQLPTLPYERVIFVCCKERDPGKDACANRGSVDILEKLKETVYAKGLKGRIRVARSMCFDLCSMGPNVAIMPENVWYRGVTMDDVPKIVAQWVDPLIHNPQSTIHDPGKPR